MALIDIGIFKGEIPKASSKLLPIENAASAINCDLESGNLQPIKGVTSVLDVLAGTTTIHRMASSFLQWTSIVNVVKAFVADSGNRIIFTGDGYPKDTNAALSLVSSPFPTSTRRLGIPSPTNALTITLIGTAGEDTIHSSSYVYTIVGKWADGSDVESAPSPPTALYDIKEGITPRLTGFTDSTATGVYTTHFRIYRLNPGNAGSAYQFVDEILITATQYDDTKTDDDLEGVLKTAVPERSISWDAPAATLTGLIATSYGLVFGFKGNTIYPSEVFANYAYPLAYGLVTESDVVGIGYTGATCIALTKTVPYLLIGQNPETIELKRLGYNQKCLSARSIVNFPGGVAYASPDGLFILNDAGLGTLATRGLFKKSQWKALGPENIFGFYYDDCYLGFFSGTTSGFSLNIETGEFKRFTLPQNVYGGEYSPDDDLLYLIQQDTAPAATPTMVDQKNCDVSVSGTVECDSDVGGASGVAYSSNSIADGAVLSFKVGQIDANVACGLTENPTGSTFPYAIDFGWRVNNSAATINEGMLPSVTPDEGPQTVTTDSVLKVVYDGATIKYYIDDVLKHTSSSANISADMVFYADVGIYGVGPSVTDILFDDGNKRKIVSWETGSYLDHAWTSKLFTFTAKTQFTACKVQGNFTAGNLTFDFYQDGALYFSKTVSNESIFRITAPKKGLSFQVKVSGKSTVDRILVGGSIAEIVERLRNV